MVPRASAAFWKRKYCANGAKTRSSAPRTYSAGIKVVPGMACDFARKRLTKRTCRCMARASASGGASGAQRISHQWRWEAKQVGPSLSHKSNLPLTAVATCRHSRRKTIAVDRSSGLNALDREHSPSVVIWDNRSPKGGSAGFTREEVIVQASFSK